MLLDKNKSDYLRKLSYEKINQPTGRIFITWRLVLFMVSAISAFFVIQAKVFVHLFLAIFFWQIKLLCAFVFNNLFVFAVKKYFLLSTFGSVI